RKWGNSIGTTIPPEIVEKEKIKPNDKIVISVHRITPFQKLFGTWKTKKTAQKIKDEIKKGWE
ncbi:AbrB/MazE/SpoVT family DNA-binding domain-containing protein, partial [Candidatus Micrarchaeota archaeon]|nr:AbrB/MazE/SpoVT family DNA-binding domain-containing protein [Candidatus Micrarchaeota archaeon]MBU1930908.1 AbrB/MazE/SpoVT family DNA-binding domain-containing protein [Candidatus Micrarchaeota archaeon]